MQNLKQAVLWEPAAGGLVRCNLCSWRCMVADGKCGHCAVRQNLNGVLYTLVYDKICAANIDPIEKKPLFHFLPGSSSFSIATNGCNFQCGFCQNWQISQMAQDGKIEGQAVSPQKIVDLAVRSGCRSISYTYTEPTVFMELSHDCGLLAKEEGLKNVFVSNGYQTKEAIDFAKDWLDAVNIDVKSFSEGYYKKLCKARLQPVLDTVTYIAKHTDIWMEITTLIVPGENDSEDELKRLANFLVGLDPAIPWHISRFYPQYRMEDKDATAVSVLERAYEIGRAAGLHYVYVGNVPGAKGESTFCHKCGELLIARVGFKISADHIKNASCPKCHAKVVGIWR